jgi:hypothetical protein
MTLVKHREIEGLIGKTESPQLIQVLTGDQQNPIRYEKRVWVYWMKESEEGLIEAVDMEAPSLHSPEELVCISFDSDDSGDSDDSSIEGVQE